MPSLDRLKTSKTSSEWPTPFCGLPSTRFLTETAFPTPFIKGCNQNLLKPAVQTRARNPVHPPLPPLAAQLLCRYSETSRSAQQRTDFLTAKRRPAAPKINCARSTACCCRLLRKRCSGLSLCHSQRSASRWRSSAGSVGHRPSGGLLRDAKPSISSGCLRRGRWRCTSRWHWSALEQSRRRLP